MATTSLSVPAGTVSNVLDINPYVSVCVGPSVLGGSVLLEYSLDGRTNWTPWSFGTITQAASYRAPNYQHIRVTATTANASVSLNDMSGANTQTVDQIVNSVRPFATASATTEQVVYSFRTPPGWMNPNFTMAMRIVASLSNNANVKTMRVRWGGVGGTALFTSPSIASLANYTANILLFGRGDGQSLLGPGTISGTAGGWGGSTGALVALTQDYLNSESEIVVTLTKATAGDTAQLEGMIVELF